MMDCLEQALLCGVWDEAGHHVDNSPTFGQFARGDYWNVAIQIVENEDQAVHPKVNLGSQKEASSLQIQKVEKKPQNDLYA